LFISRLRNGNDKRGGIAVYRTGLLARASERHTMREGWISEHLDFGKPGFWNTMPVLETHERSLGRPRGPARGAFGVAQIRWGHPCVKIIVFGNLFFALAISLQIGLNAGLRPMVKIAESNGPQVSSQIRIPCRLDHRVLYYGFEFFTVIRNTYVVKGTICRDIPGGRWVWRFNDPEFSRYNSY